MPLTKRTLSEMSRESLRYLSVNTDLSYFSQGSIVKALVESSNLEISRLQEFVVGAFDNCFLSTASGLYLDLFGELLGLPRIRDRKAAASIQDGSVRFYVDSGTLGSKLPSPVPGMGMIPAGTTISNASGDIVFQVTSDTSFPVNARSAFVPVRATTSGAEFNVGANQLVVHSLSNPNVKVTNDISIVSGSDVETDAQYKYRLSKAFTTKYGANRTAIQIAASSRPGVSRSEIVPYARGAGTFDVLLIPQGNKLAQSTIDEARRVVESVAAFGVSPMIREPVYVAFKVMAQLRFNANVEEGTKAASRRAAESAVLAYFASIPLGGEMVLNQLRSSILSASSTIKDVKILEFCLDGKPKILSNIQLVADELFVPDDTAEDAVKMI